MSILKELSFPRIIFGGNVFGWTLNEQESFKILDELLEHGFNGIDTADMYSTWVPGNQGGESERIIGNWMKSRKNRDQIKLITKVGMEIGGKQGLGKDYILEASKASLKRLNTDYIDVYLSHQEDPSTAIDETLQAYQTLKEEKKVLAVGASNYSIEGFQQSLKVSAEQNLPRYEVYQPEYNLYDRSKLENGFNTTCQANSVDVITYFSLASGFLSGKYRSKADASKSARGESVVNTYLNERGIKILSALDQIALDKNTSLTSVAIAWIMHQDFVYAPIVSATTSEQLKEVIAAAQLELSSDELGALDL